MLYFHQAEKTAKAAVSTAEHNDEQPHSNASDRDRVEPALREGVAAGRRDRAVGGGSAPLPWQASDHGGSLRRVRRRRSLHRGAGRQAAGQVDTSDAELAE